MLCVAAVTTAVFRRLRQPVILGYLLAGLIVGPHTPIPLFADMDRVHLLAELGVILVMFSVGLELSIRKLARVVPTSGLVGLIQVGSMMWLGYMAGQAFGWTSEESLVTGGMIAISSTMIVARVFADERPARAVSETVFGVLVVQDLVAILLLALLTASSSGRGMPAAVLGHTAGQLVVFLLGIVVIGFLVIPRTMRAIARLKSRETLLVASVGLCFALAVLAQKVGYSVALGAFLAGSLVAESGEADHVEHLIRPLKDMFAAVFSVAVGMVLDPAVIAEHWLAIVVLVGVILAGQVVSVSVGALLSGRDVRTAVQAGMSLAQIGEFSFILASVAVAAGMVRSFLYPVAVAVAVVTTFTTPWLIRSSARAAVVVDRRLPKRMQTFVSLYGSWLEELRTRKGGQGTDVRRFVRLLALDAALLGGIVVGTGLGGDSLIEGLHGEFRVPPEVARWVIVAVAFLVSVPLLMGIARTSRNLGARLAVLALPEGGQGQADLAATPRRVFVVTVQIGVILAIGIPLLALTQPFVPAPYGVACLFIALSASGVAFWRRAADLDEHVRAGTHVILEALGKQSSGESTGQLEEAHPLLPGFGPLTPVRLEPGSVAIGKTLAEINLRALSGASVVTILRGNQGLKPTGREQLAEDDVLALAGTHEAIRAATDMLRGSEFPPAVGRE